MPIILRDWNRQAFDLIVDAKSGKLLKRRLRTSSRLRGFGKRQFRALPVLVYKDTGPHGQRQLVLRRGRQEIIVNESICHADLSVSFGGLRRRLTVTSGIERIEMRDWTVEREIFRRIDPTYDDLDESTEDFLGWLTELIANRDRQERLIEYWIGGGRDSRLHEERAED